MTRRLPSPLRWLLPALLATGAAAAFAHTGADGAAHQHDVIDALAAGFAHPFTGLDHLAAMGVLGLWSGLTARRAWLAPLAFVSALLLGATLGLGGVALPMVEPMIAASLLVLGLLLAASASLPVMAGVALAAVFAVFHGVAHGQELGGANGSWALAGMVGATALLHAAGIGLGLAMKHSQRWLPRIAGGAVALFGLSLLFTA
jgi:urease accessory protein